jgi:cytochrome c-type biogenesis protein CcmF
VAIAATVLFGTLFPLMVEAVADARVSVGAPYFERVIGPLALGLLVLAGIGPTLPWGDWTPDARRRLVPGGLSAAAAAITLLLVDGRPAVIAAGAAAVFALVGSVWLIGRRGRALRHRGRGPGIDCTRRSLGGLTAHAGASVIGLAVLASTAGQTDITATLRAGETLRLGSDVLTFDGLAQSQEGAGRDAMTALMQLRGGDEPRRVSPSLTLVTATNSTVATPAIVPSALADLYVTLTNVDPSGEAATFRFARYPFVSWLWVGGGILVTGGLLAAWPARRRPRQPAGDRTVQVALDHAPDGI